ncbi:FapA family protein [Saccharibacillus sp. CPCC 101409]|uniref:FapA family protein n=1 Tax=Saccharibacillus sp. CPCC 101409 TaxID=3058041 RepID=UPI0026712504|nr:FapA family protein [Saccharibacillus sp. CPCC 101409]MDO3409111.1 FapA family protein [Saccharibacillus sp. CPCC 101409]
MERSIITRAKSAEMAVEEALKLLAVSRETVQIEILEPGGRGMLGLGGKLAVVKVVVLPPASAAAQTPSPSSTGAASEAAEAPRSGEPPADPGAPPAASPGFLEQAARPAETAGLGRDGSAERRESASPAASAPVSVATELASASGTPETAAQEASIGIVGGRFVIEATGGSHPLLTPPAGVLMYKNGTPIEDKVSVAPEDRITLETRPEPEEPVWTLELDDKAMQAKLQFRPAFARTFTLLDSEPRPHLVVPVEETRTPLPLPAEAVRERLLELGVVYGVRGDRIAAACASETPGMFVVAEGTPAVEGADGKFELTFETETKRLGPQSREDGTIDYREIIEFPNVTEGQVLVRTLPPRPGRPGRDLLDRPVEPRAVNAVQLMAGKGVSVTEDGRRAVALVSGMPQLKKQGIRIHLSILPKLVQRGDVDLKSGNIRFRGDVEVSGGIQNGMEVEAFGSLTVKGTIGSAAVDASYSLTAGNLIGAKVNVGKGNAFLQEIEPLLLEIASQTQLLQSAIGQLGQTAAFKLNDLQQAGLGALLSVLLRGKFKSLNQTLTQFMQQMDKNETQLEDEWKAYVAELKHGFFDARSGGFRGPSELDAFRRRTLDLYGSICGPQDRPIFIDLQYAHNSHIYCGGGVRSARGAYNTMLFCQGILESGGTLRGGVYFAGRGMSIREVGAPGGVATKLQVPDTAFVKAVRVLEGTVVQVGSRSFQFVEEAQNVNARLSPSGELLLF